MKGKPDNDAHCFKHAFSHPSSDPCPYCRIAELEKRLGFLEAESDASRALNTPLDAAIRIREQRRLNEYRNRDFAAINEAFVKAREAVQPIIDREQEIERMTPSGEWKA